MSNQLIQPTAADITLNVDDAALVGGATAIALNGPAGPAVPWTLSKTSAAPLSLIVIATLSGSGRWMASPGQIAAAALGFNATTIADLVLPSFFPIGTVPASLLLPTGGIRMARPGIFSAMTVSHVGNALNGAQTATYDLLVSGAVMATIAGVATTAGTKTGSVLASVPYAAGDVIQPRITLSVGLTALLTSVQIGVG